jgi:CDP-paratose 2-epimerase
MEEREMTKVVVTGGAGFIGCHTADHFANNNDEVVIYDNFSRSQTLGTVVKDDLLNWHYLTRRHSNIKLVKDDIRNFEGVRSASKNASAIVHCAGQVAVKTSLTNPILDFETNVTGTINVLEAARVSDSAVIFCSTNKVYGEHVNAIPVSDDDSLRYSFASKKFATGIPEDFPTDRTGHTPYGSSKLAADIYVQDYAHSYGLKTGVFRLSCIYGENQFGIEDQGWVAWFAIASLTGKPITIYGDGRQVRDTLYVKDLIAAFDSFLRSKIRHDVFNVGGGPENSISLLELLQMLRKQTGVEPKVSFSNWRPADQKVYISDIRKIRRELGWKPSVTTEDGTKRLINWIRENRTSFN